MPKEQAMTPIEQAAQVLRELIRVAKDGRDAMYAEAQQYHEAMKGYRPERHANMDEEVAGADRAIAAAESALASLEAAKQESCAGWQFVPVQPTVPMMDAYARAFISEKRFDMREVWADMLAAAPSPRSGT